MPAACGGAAISVTLRRSSAGLEPSRRDVHAMTRADFYFFFFYFFRPLAERVDRRA
jgi:hypothetical protein